MWVGGCGCGCVWVGFNVGVIGGGGVILSVCVCVCVYVGGWGRVGEGGKPERDLVSGHKKSKRRRPQLMRKGQS